MKQGKKAALIITPVIAAVAAFTAVGILSSGGYSGKVTANGTPMANVSVSDGRNVVRTDADGVFSLKGWSKTHFITVTAPAGYTTEKYYIAADRKKRDGYDFELSPSSVKAGEGHTFLQISDTEINEKGVGEWINYLKETAKENNAAFLIHTGDICYEAGLKRHIKDMNTQTMGLPVRYVIGNHDYVEGKYGEELYESLYGPVWYSFEVGNVHYIVTPFKSGGDYKSRYSEKDYWKWVANDIENTDKNMKIVMFNHTNAPSDDYVISYGSNELDLKKHNLIAWIFGHYHYNFVEENNGVLNISTARPDCGGIDSSVSGARIINIATDGTITSEMRFYDYVGSVKNADTAVWTAQLDGNVLYCNTVTDGGRIYTATVDEGYPVNCGVFCIDAENGNIIWKYKTENSVKNNIVVNGDNIFVQDCAGNVYCIDKNSGEKKWQTVVSLGSSLNTSVGICFSDGILYTGCAAAVTALNADTGEKVWENIRNYGESSPAEFVITGDKLLVSSHWDALIALDKTTGKEIWKNKDSDIRFRSSTPVAVDENTVLVADSDAIMLVDVTTGEITVKKDDTGINFSSSAQPYTVNGKAYIPTADKGLVIFDLASDEIIKTVSVGKAEIYTAPYVSGDAQSIEPTATQAPDGNIVFGASDGNVYTISPDGDVLKTAELGAPVFGSCVFYGNDIVVSDFSGRVLRIPYLTTNGETK